MIPAILLASSISLSAEPVSVLDAAARTSYYRMFYGVAPEDREEPFNIKDLKQVILVDINSIRRIRNNYRALRIVHVRHRLSYDDNRAIIAYGDFEVNCNNNDAKLSDAIFENVDGIVADQNSVSWRPTIPGSVVNMLFDAVCSTSRPGSDIGPMDRSGVINILEIKDYSGEFTIKPRFDFPRRAIERGVSVGVAEVSCKVDRSESLTDCRVIYESDDGLGFGSSAITALESSKYKTDNFGDIVFSVRFSISGENFVESVVEP